MKKSILVVSEKKETLKQVRKSLSEIYEVISFINLLDAIDMLRESDFDAVLLDENLIGFTFSEAKKKLNGVGKDFVVMGLLNEEDERLINEMQEVDVYNYLLKPVDIKEMNKILPPALRTLELIKEKKKLEEKISNMEESNDIIGQSTKLKDVKNLAEKAAENDLTILITGENGVGKALIAKEIHNKSDRRKEEYVYFSCESIPDDLIERELFGYEKGAFLGANSSKKGILEEVFKGTIYIDEITALDLKVQSKILKAIEYGEVKRIGGTKTRKTNIRFIVSTNKDIKVEAEKGSFRKDLYNRITSFPIEVPSLRDRKDDIPILANYFLGKIAKDLKVAMPVISGEAMKYLMEYSYPGNIRELENIVERMIILSEDRILDVENLPLEIKMKSGTIENKTIIGVGPLKNILEQEIYSLDGVEKVVIAMALQKTRWNKQETSKILGIGRTTLYEKIRKYNLETN